MFKKIITVCTLALVLAGCGNNAKYSGTELKFVKSSLESDFPGLNVNVTTVNDSVNVTIVNNPSQISDTEIQTDALKVVTNTFAIKDAQVTVTK